LSVRISLLALSSAWPSAMPRREDRGQRGGQRGVDAGILRGAEDVLDARHARGLRQAVSCMDSEDDPADAIIACTRLRAGQLRGADWDRRMLVQHHRPGIRRPRLRFAAGASATMTPVTWPARSSTRWRAPSWRCQISRSDKPLQVAGTHLARLIATYR
jgi:hypothetical protein